MLVLLPCLGYGVEQTLEGTYFGYSEWCAADFSKAFTLVRLCWRAPDFKRHSKKLSKPAEHRKIIPPGLTIHFESFIRMANSTPAKCIREYDNHRWARNFSKISTDFLSTFHKR